MGGDSEYNNIQYSAGQGSVRMRHVHAEIITYFILVLHVSLSPTNTHYIVGPVRLFGVVNPGGGQKREP